ncbi:MAG: hypothetical protein OEM23_03140 [Gemmatimonadota bacterium]|nr:hypothetical protein [Gemmatimonadota bacterium]MDH3427407.1 hypothetical protein [Gemmatimonadota bacterium]
MKFATSVLMMAATAGLALLALTARKQMEFVETPDSMDHTADHAAPRAVPAEADAWFV